MIKIYYIWELKEKSNVPVKILETESDSIFMEYVASLIEDDKQFATRVERRKK